MSANNTAPPAQRLSEADQARVRTFLARILQMLPLLGVSAFEGTADDPAPASGVSVRLSALGTKATGIYSSEGLRVLAGSRARSDEVESIGDSPRATRRRLRDSGVLQSDGDALVFTRDHLFRSPSGASSALMGRNSNGWTDWTLPDGRRLTDWLPSAPDQTI